jgi:hypothetical protein
MEQVYARNMVYLANPSTYAWIALTFTGSWPCLISQAFCICFAPALKSGKLFFQSGFGLPLKPALSAPQLPLPHISQVDLTQQPCICKLCMSWLLNFWTSSMWPGCSSLGQEDWSQAIVLLPPKWPFFRVWGPLPTRSGTGCISRNRQHFDLSSIQLTASGVLCGCSWVTDSPHSIVKQGSWIPSHHQPGLDIQCGWICHSLDTLEHLAWPSAAAGVH